MFVLFDCGSGLWRGRGLECPCVSELCHQSLVLLQARSTGGLQIGMWKRALAKEHPGLQGLGFGTGLTTPPGNR